MSRLLLALLASFLLSLNLTNGAPEGRIIGGSNAVSGQFPYVVSIMLDGVHHCSGFIYSQKWVVSAASCFKNSPAPSALEVVVGQISFISIDPDEDYFEVLQIVVNPTYNPTTGLNDIALLELSRTITFGPNVNLICYEQLEASGSPMGTVMGWGATQEGGLESLRLLSKTITLNGDCTVWGATYDPRYMICAGSESDLGGPCNLDEGSPLVQDGLAVGIVSLHDCGIYPFNSSIYTRLASYFDWFQRVAGFQPSSCATN